MRVVRRETVRADGKTTVDTQDVLLVLLNIFVVQTSVEKLLL